jgi:hypothetical protein
LRWAEKRRPFERIALLPRELERRTPTLGSMLGEFAGESSQEKLAPPVPVGYPERECVFTKLMRRSYEL